jgi:3-hydroxyisobutyrate dehydrogenase
MRIAFLGIGNMGGPMAACLLRAGHDVIGYDVVPAMLEGHVRSGGRAANSVAEAVGTADVVVTMLPSGKHVREVYTGADGVFAALGDRKPLLIDSSTIDVATARDVAAAAASRGIEMLDAPVSGGVAGATAGTLTFMVGGTETAFTRALPLLQAMGRNVVLAGSSGAGQAAKICNNMMLGINMIAVSEGFALAERLGLDFQKLFEISSTSSGQSWSLTSNCPVPGPVPNSAANRDYAAGFAAALMLKDLALSQEAAEATGAPTPLGAHAARIYAQVAAEQGGKDFSVVYRWLSAKSRGEIV